MRDDGCVLLGRTLDNGWVDCAIQLNAKSLPVPPDYCADCRGAVGQIDHDLVACPDIRGAFPSNPLFGHIAHQDFDHAQAGMTHLRLEQPPLTIM